MGRGTRSRFGLEPIATSFETLLQAITHFREDIVLGAECMFGWYWLADRCAEHGIPSVLGHALYMKLIDGGVSYYHCSGEWYRQVGSGSAVQYKAVAAP